MSEATYEMLLRLRDTPIGEWLEHPCIVADEAMTEIKRLREALEKIAALDVPRPVVARYRADGKPSKYDRCAHTINMWDDCARCISSYANAALAEKGEK